MQLEVLRQRGTGAQRPVDVLLVHGSFGGAWMWEPHVMPFLGAAGYDVAALSLRGHGRSPTDIPVPQLSLRHYAEDVAQAAGAMERPAVVVGHSLGGAAVQAALAAGASFAGTVLLASVPPFGLARANMEMFWQRPALWGALARLLSSGARDVDLGVLREGLFDNRIDADDFRRVAARLSPESAFAAAEVQGLLPFAPLPWQVDPVLVMGGTRDWFIRPLDVAQTAAWYGTSPVLIEGLSHAAMLDPDWRKPAQAVVDWMVRFEA